MAFDLIAAGGYGAGELGDVIDPTGNINSIANVASTAVGTDTTTLTVWVQRTATNCPFEAGSELLLYAAAGNSAVGEDEYSSEVEAVQGKWAVATITAVNNESGTQKILTVDKALTDFAGSPLNIGSTDVAYVVAITIPHYRNLTLNAGCYLRPTLSGCPLALKCSGTLTLNGGHIDLQGFGCGGHITTGAEVNGIKDTDKYSGWENSALKDRLSSSVPYGGDGTAFILVNKLVVADDSSRIGNPDTQGVQFCRGASDSPNCPANVTNINGSHILLVAGSITDFTPKIIAKYRSLDSYEISLGVADKPAGYSLAACYIASNTRLTNDEGLYAYDCISDTDRLATLGIHDFGNGSKGSTTIEDTVQNCYAQVTAVDSETRKTLTIGALVTGGAEAFALGALVMVHFNHKNYNNTAHSGRFICAKITGVTDSTFTLDIAVPQTLVDNFANYNCQVVSIPQYENATCSSAQAWTPQYNGLTGGIFAVAVSDTLDLRMGGSINVEGKGRSGGGDTAYKSAGLRWIGNAQDNNKLPIGQGHGSVFILANKIIMDENTRIGATYSGAAFGGLGGSLGTHDAPPRADFGGYKGTKSTRQTKGINGAAGSPSPSSGAWCQGGRGSNGRMKTNPVFGGARQGAHIMIIADTITGFNQAAVSTGGEGSQYGTEFGGYGGGGGAGYGGGGAAAHAHGEYSGEGGSGGYLGGGDGGICLAPNYESQHFGAGGGGSGWAFIYCNHAVNQDTTDTVY